MDESILSDVIIKCEQYGNAVSAMPYNEQIFIKEDDISTKRYIPRETLMRVVTPQAYKYKKLDDSYHSIEDSSLSHVDVTNDNIKEKDIKKEFEDINNY